MKLSPRTAGLGTSVRSGVSEGVGKGANSSAALIARLAVCLCASLMLVLSLLMLTACSSKAADGGSSGSTQSGTAAQASKVFVLGDTTFNPENEEPDVNPHNTYSGWACIRYGIGETLFKYSDTMEIEPWLASSFENLDELSWKIQLKDNLKFSNGRALDAQAVKECLEDLIVKHERAQKDLNIDSIEADRLSLIIKTKSPNPTFLNYLSDPYGCIIDMQAGVSPEGIVVGSGPYVVRSLNSGEKLELVKNEQYWNGEPGFDEVKVLTISDGDTLTMALQSGEIDAAYGMPYASYPLFDNDQFTISSSATSRAFFVDMNFKSEIIQDKAVRQALAMGINKERFVNELLAGNGFIAQGVFPSSFSFGGKAVKAKSYDPEAAKAILDEAGWKDGDGDGIREKDGKKLSIRWLSYPSRQELPLLAEAAQSNLKELGFDIHINVTADHNSLRRDPSAWDVYANAMVTAPTGDPAYFFTSRCLDSSTANNGSYHNDKLEALAKELQNTFDTSKRNELAVQMQEILLEDDAFVFCSHLKMSLISKASISGFIANPCDFYEITAELKPAA